MNRILMLVVTLIALIGCNQPTPPKGNPASTDTKQSTTGAKLPVFRLATSEYPSWSTFMVASKLGIINGAEGKYGELERLHGVDVVLNVVDYDQCFNLYGGGSSDAVCITNMDIMPLAKTRKSTAIAPTSTSVGADQLIVTDIADFDELKNYQINLLKKSVSDYVVYSILEKAGKNYRDYKIANLDPAAAATALQSNSKAVRAICVWNPFALNTTKKNPNAKVIGSSAQCPEEVVDMLVIADDSLSKPKGESFAQCLIDTQYSVNKLLYSNDKATSNKALKMLGEDFSDLPVDDMRVVLTETQFYQTPESGIALFDSQGFKDTNNKVVRICQEIEVLDSTNTPTIGSDIKFDTRFMKASNTVSPKAEALR